MTQLAPAPLPPDVAQLAHAHDLGAWRDTFPPNKRWRIIVSTGLLFAMALIFTLVFAAGPVEGAQIMVVIDLGLAGLFLWALLSSPVVSAAARARQFYMFERGYVHVGRSGPQAYRWDQVREVYQEIVQTRYNGINTGTNYRYRLEFTDGRQAKYNTMSADMSRFGPVIQTEVSQAQLPLAWQAIQAGQTLAFGPFAITGGGISYGHKEALPWSAIRSVDIAQGTVRVLQPGKMLAYGSANAKAIPNLYTFLALTHKLTGR
jgi:hypothetical protein